MSSDDLLNYDSINWLKLWQNARRAQGNRSKSAEDWDKKAPGFAQRNRTSPFINLLLARLPITKEMTVLDVGCGPGSLSLPLSQVARQVTAMDFSSRMLSYLQNEIDQQGITNISLKQCAWEDDWHQAGITRHDIAIASRSLGVEDLETAIAKLAAHAKHAVFIADRIAPTPYAPEAFKAIGRDFTPGPDYIYTVNILYTMGIYPHIEIMELPSETVYPSLDEAIAAYSWMLKDLSKDESLRLHSFLAQQSQVNDDGTISIRRQQPLRWALIWWHKDNS